MAVHILSEADLQRNRRAFQKRLRVELRLACEEVETAVDARIREHFFVGRPPPYEVRVTIPETVVEGDRRVVFADIDDYCRKIIPLVRKNYSRAGWSSVVKRSGATLRFILNRKAG